MDLNQFLDIAKASLLDSLQQRHHFTRGVPAEFSFARF